MVRLYSTLTKQGRKFKPRSKAATVDALKHKGHPPLQRWKPSKHRKPSK